MAVFGGVGLPLAGTEAGRRSAAEKALSNMVLGLAVARPAKNLTDAEALDLLLALHAAGEITLPDGVTRGAAGKVTSPKPGVKLRVGTTMRGVTYAAPSYTRTAGAMGFGPIKSFSATPAFAIVLYKLAMLLADRWQVTTVVSGGVGSGRLATDAHGEGRGIDFYGVVRAGGATIDVLRDWYLRPVQMPPGPQSNQKLVKVDDDNWGNATATFYRLATSTDPQDGTPRQVFAAVYRFAYEQTHTTTADTLPANFDSRGVPLGQGYIWHPDSPIAGRFAAAEKKDAAGNVVVKGLSPIAGRRPHQHHMHFQLGSRF